MFAGAAYTMVTDLSRHGVKVDLRGSKAVLDPAVRAPPLESELRFIFGTAVVLGLGFHNLRYYISTTLMQKGGNRLVFAISSS